MWYEPPKAINLATLYATLEELRKRRGFPNWSNQPSFSVHVAGAFKPRNQRRNRVRMTERKRVKREVKRG